jgi:branched-chain amino acid transport system permease protein
MSDPPPNKQLPSLATWLVPLLAGALVAAGVGIVVQQLLRRWNEGQELRQALITLGVTFI